MSPIQSPRLDDDLREPEPEVRPAAEDAPRRGRDRALVGRRAG